MINIFITTGSPSTPPPPSRSILARGEMRSEFSFSTFFYFSICVLLLYICLRYRPIFLRSQMGRTRAWSTMVATFFAILMQTLIKIK